MKEDVFARLEKSLKDWQIARGGVKRGEFVGGLASSAARLTEIIKRKLGLIKQAMNKPGSTTWR